MESETAVRRQCLPWFAEHEIASLDNDSRILWLFVYAVNIESNCHCGEVGARLALSWMDDATFDRAFENLRERGLMVRSECDEQLLLEAIDPNLLGEAELWK